jgi:hypothetical protein
MIEVVLSHMIVQLLLFKSLNTSNCTIYSLLSVFSSIPFPANLVATFALGILGSLTTPVAYSSAHTPPANRVPSVPLQNGVIMSLDKPQSANQLFDHDWYRVGKVREICCSIGSELMLRLLKVRVASKLTKVKFAVWWFQMRCLGLGMRKVIQFV